MPGPTVNWKKLDTGAWRSEIVEGGRYQLASPSTVTGNPSLAMQAGQSCTVRVYIGGTLYPDASLTVNGTTPVAILNAVGQPLTGQEKFDLVIEVAMPYGENLLTTDEPNGSPSSPFTSEAQRTAWATANLASLLTGRTTVWGPGNVEYVWTGPLATDWRLASKISNALTFSALLGDSIVAQYSSCAAQAATLLGDVVVINSAVGGTKIEAQAAKIPDILAAGAKRVFVQVGTNNLGDAASELYAKYIALYSSLLASGLDVVVILIPPRSSAYSSLIYKCNNACYYAAKSLGIPTFDPWLQFALEAGGWSVATVNSDNVHPVPSARTTAAATLVSQIRNNAKAFPIVRNRADSLISNACFAVDGGSDGVADGWATETSGTVAFSLEADGSGGHKWQKIAITNPGTSDYGSVKQSVTTGFSVGDTMVFRGNLSMDIDDSVDDKCFASVYVRFLTAGSATISSVYANNALKQSVGVSNFECVFVVPATTATIEIVVGTYCWQASTAVFAVRVSRVGLLNLTALAIPVA